MQTPSKAFTDDFHSLHLEEACFPHHPDAFKSFQSYDDSMRARAVIMQDIFKMHANFKAKGAGSSDDGTALSEVIAAWGMINDKIKVLTIPANDCVTQAGLDYKKSLNIDETAKATYTKKVAAMRAAVVAFVSKFTQAGARREVCIWFARVILCSLLLGGTLIHSS